MGKRTYSYEDEKIEALEIYLSKYPKLKKEYEFKERNLALMKIKVDIQIIGRLTIKRFRQKCDKIIAEVMERGNEW